jgi:hypothetical protein
MNFVLVSSRPYSRLVRSTDGGWCLFTSSSAKRYSSASTAKAAQTRMVRKGVWSQSDTLVVTIDSLSLCLPHHTEVS